VALPPQKRHPETFTFPAPKEGGKLTLRARLTFIFIVPPPAETQSRIQQRIIARVQDARHKGDQAAVDAILNKEIPARMRSMNVLATTVPDIQMAEAKTELTAPKIGTAPSPTSPARSRRTALPPPQKAGRGVGEVGSASREEAGFIAFAMHHAGLTREQVLKGLKWFAGGEQNWLGKK